MKSNKFATLMSVFALLLTTGSAQAWPWNDPISSSQLPAPPDQTTLDWWSNNADASGYSDRLLAIGDTARVAQSIANAAQNTANQALTTGTTAQDSANNALGRADKAYSKANRPVDFAGKTMARESRQAALAFAIKAARQDTANKDLQAILQRLQTKKSLSASQEKLVAEMWLVYVSSGGDAQTRIAELETRIDQLASQLTNLQNDYFGRVHDLQARVDSTQRDIQDVAHVTATALGAKDPTTGKSPSGKEEKAARDWLANF